MYKEIINRQNVSLGKIASPKIACVMMVRNECKRIHISLESVVNVVSCFIILDTISTDNTIEIIDDFCKKHNKNLYLIQDKFVDFSYSRNVLLDYCDKFDVDFLLLLDCNDELKNGEILLQFAKQELKTTTTSYLIMQEWWSGDLTCYYNVRFVKPKNNWRYKEPVHEYFSNPSGEQTMVKIPTPVKLYQDRTKDDDKTLKRFYRDKKVLFKEYLKNPKNPRTVFYLAQTLSCLNEYEESFKYYEIRSKMLDGFWEERFQSYLRLAAISKSQKQHDKEVIYWLIKAIEISPRAEPLIELAKLIDSKSWFLSYHFSKLASELKYPEHENLFIDDLCYNYTRYHKLGIYGYYHGDHEIGKSACQKAIEFGNQEIDKTNLKHYLEREKKLNISKKEYINIRNKTLKNENPNLSQKQIMNKIKNEWKIKKLIL